MSEVVQQVFAGKADVGCDPAALPLLSISHISFFLFSLVCPFSLG
jgi:hypothetical protein